MTDDLKKLAEAATPGPWQLSGVRHTSAPAIGSDTRLLQVGPDGDELAMVFFDMQTGKGHADAKFIAAANPVAVLNLIRERDEAFRVIRETLWMAQRYATGRQSYAVGKYNDAAKLALKIRAVKAERDEVLWALDGGNTASLSGLKDDEFKAASEYRDALSAAREEVARAVAAERAAWEAELRPLIEAGAFEGADFEKCEKCGSLLSVDEVARVDDGPTGCWRYLTGREQDPCPGDGRKRVTMALTKEPTDG